MTKNIYGFALLLAFLAGAVFFVGRAIYFSPSSTTVAQATVTEIVEEQCSVLRIDCGTNLHWKYTVTAQYTDG